MYAKIHFLCLLNNSYSLQLNCSNLPRYCTCFCSCHGDILKTQVTYFASPARISCSI